MRLRSAVLVALLTGLTATAAAAQETENHLRALAAGYKASFLCSGMFDANRTQAQVEAEELSRIYPEYRPIAPTMTAAVDAKARTVSVPFAPNMPPRIAAWRPLLGCSQLPIGARPEAIGALPRLDLAPPALDGRPWPMGDARAEAPKLTMAVSTALSHATAAAFDRKTYGEGADTTGVVIVQNGRIIAERYRDGFDLHTSSRTWSAAKSITGTLVGIAVKQGLVQVDAPARIPEWSRPGDPRAAITLADLMHMGSGLYSEKRGNRTDMIYFGGTAVTEKATAMPLEAPPGKRWKYANDDTLLIVRSLRAALGDDRRYLALPFQELFWKIGMTHTTPETDWAGNYVMSSQVWTTPRDLARLGMLYLNDGVWNGERILPEGWARFVATPAPAQPEPATRTGHGYGAQFWLLGPKQGLPEGTYAAEGSQGQFLIIVPSERLVIVRRGLDGLAPGEAQFDIDAFSRDVIAALKARGV
ncbi:MAG: serine hydrolase [Proteobacteria bacterium]|nr:serine hydrolase [Pseudomonadota bacterium]